MHRVVVLGGGFAGLEMARRLRRQPLEVTLLDRRNFHLFQPLLYQVATGGLSPGEITMPLRRILRRQKNATVLLGEAVDFDVERNRVRLADDEELPYDTLVVATGMRNHYFGHPQWAQRAPGLKTIEDATRIRSDILRAFERAERAGSPDERGRHLTFVIVGAGPTGVELAGTIAEMARRTLRGEFRRIDPTAVRLRLVDAADRVLPPYPPELSESARRTLEEMGVEVQTGTRVLAIDTDSVTLTSDGGDETVALGNVFWAAGVAASSLVARLAERAGCEVDRAGRAKVLPDGTLPGHPEIFVLGDAAHLEGPDGRPLPGVAPAALQQGRHAAKNLCARLRGRPTEPFRYRDKGSLAVIGRAAAVAQIGPLRFSGIVAWLLWLFIHILYLVGFANRVLVLVQWAQSYIARGRGARLIAHDETVTAGNATAAGEEPAHTRPPDGTSDGDGVR